MTEILDYGLDSPARAFLLLILSVEDKLKEKAMNKLHFHKALYYFEKLQQDERITFSNYKYGGVSFELTENMETLEESGLVTRTGTKYSLTSEGEKLATKLVPEYDSETLNRLRYAKCLLNDLSDKELLFFMYMTFPETKKNSTEFENLLKDKNSLTRRLFLRRRIDAGTAAQWLGMNQRDFLNSLS